MLSSGAHTGAHVTVVATALEADEHTEVHRGPIGVCRGKSECTLPTISLMAVQGAAQSAQVWLAGSLSRSRRIYTAISHGGIHDRK